MSRRLVSLLAAIAVLPAAMLITSAHARRSFTASLARSVAAANHAPGTSTIGTLPRALVGNTPQDAAFDPASRTVYVANQNDDTLSVVDARRCNARDTAGCR